MERAKYVSVQLRRDPSRLWLETICSQYLYIYITEYLETEGTFSGDKWIKNTGTINCRSIGL